MFKMTIIIMLYAFHRGFGALRFIVQILFKIALFFPFMKLNAA